MRTYLSFVILILIVSCSGDKALKYKKEADALAEKGDFYKAEKLYNRAITTDKELKEAWFGRGELFIKTHDYKAGIADFSEVLKLDPNYAEAWLVRGNAYHESKEYDMAMNDYNNAIRLNNKNFIAYVNRGTLHFALNEYQKSVDDYSKAIELNPKNTDLYLHRAHCYELLKRLDLNIADLKKILELTPDNNISKHNLAFSYSNAKLYSKADSLFAPLFARTPNDPFVLNNYGYVKFRMGDLKKGKELVEASIKIKPDNSYAYRNMALILLAESNKKQACMNIYLGLEKGFTKDYGTELEELQKQYCK